MTVATDAARAPASVDGVPAIELVNVSKTFTLESGERIRSVQGVSMRVEQGEFVCILGPSGQGKSTLLNLIAGFLMPTSGDVRVNGRIVTGPGPDRGVVFQRDTLFAWRRVVDNIGFGLEARGVPAAKRKQIVDHYLKVIDLERFAHAWPKQLSGGMRRRVAIASVFANEPDVLLMDEPFVGLDYVRRARLHKVLLDLWQASRRTVFFITHDIEEALMLADRIHVIVEGRIAYSAVVPFGRPRPPEVLTEPEASRIRIDVLRQIESIRTNDN